MARGLQACGTRGPADVHAGHFAGHEMSYLWIRIRPAVVTSLGTAIGVARMARFGVRSGSLERSLEDVIPLNGAV
jgi:hypothetical protein